MSRTHLLFAAATLVTIASGCGKSHSSPRIPCTTSFSPGDAGQPATLTVDTSAVVNTFVPRLMFGINSGCWYVPKSDTLSTQAKVQAAGNYFVRYPGGSTSDDYHWNGTGSYDEQHRWVPSAIDYTPGFGGTEIYRGTTSVQYQTYANLTDGDPNTRWLSNADTAFPAAQWAYVDLRAVQAVDTIQIVWGTPFAASFKVQTLSSPTDGPYQGGAGTTWQDTSAGILQGSGGTQTVTFAPANARYVRVLLTASSAGPGGAYSIAELTVLNGTTPLTKNVASASQSATTVSSTDPASQGSSQPNSFDFESFIAYLKSFTPAAEALVTVNFGTGTPQEAAAWVHYANVEQAYGIHYWQVGNELEGNWETGGPLNAQDYVNRFVAYYDAMKAEDPSIVVLGPVSGMKDASNLGDGKYFIQDFIELLNAIGKGDHIDGIDFHWYPNWGPVTDQVGLDTVSQLGWFATLLTGWLAASSKPDVPVFLTEFNMGITDTSTPVYDYQLVAGLWLANAIGEYTRLFGKSGGTVLWNALWGANTPDTTTSATGIDLGYLQFDNNTYRFQERAQYWAMQMMSSDWAIAGDTRAHQLVATTSSDPSLAAYANLRPDGALALAVVNRDEVNAYTANINLGAFRPGTAADVWTFDASNYVWETATVPYHAEPDSAPTHVLACGASASTPFTFAPASITVIRFVPLGADR